MNRDTRQSITTLLRLTHELQNAFSAWNVRPPSRESELALAAAIGRMQGEARILGVYMCYEPPELEPTLPRYVTEFLSADEVARDNDPFYAWMDGEA